MARTRRIAVAVGALVVGAAGAVVAVAHAGSSAVAYARVRDGVVCPRPVGCARAEAALAELARPAS